MATAWRVYNEAKKYMLTADLELDSTLMRIKLIKGTAAAGVSNYTRSSWLTMLNLSIAANTVVKALANIAVTAGASAKEIKFDCNDVIFTANGGNATSAQYAVIGVSGGKVLAWCQLSTVAFNITSGNTLTVQMHASGLFTLTGGTT